MFCLRKGVKPKERSIPESKNVKSPNECLADSNASFLRAARAGNLEKVLEHLKGNIDINTSNANGLNALHLAAKEGHVDVVTELLKKGANVNAATKKGNTALHIASLAGQEEVVRVLANLGANVNVQSQNGFTPLYMAAQENHDVVVSFLLANGANQSLATEDGFTPLAVALQQGHDKVVAVLLENDIKGRVRLPALHIAAKKDDCKAATLLLQNDHNPDVTSKSGFTPLHIASHYGNEKIASILLDKGADVNYAAKHQITPLHVASKWGKSNMVELLIQKGANIDAATKDGLTPLHCAARSGHDQVVDLLLEKGAPILAKTKNGLAPLHMASQGDHVDSARILLYHKAPVDDVTVDYLTALHVAAHCGHVKVAKLLLDRKADPNARALNGFTPLHIACKKNRIKVVELLLKHGASIEATTESGLSPLHVASFMGCMNIVIYLIQSGANPDVPTVRGETPLHLAARANQIDVIRILLRNGASVDAKAREEQTPLYIASRLGNVDIVSLLLQHGAAVDSTTKEMYTSLHIASKEGQEEVVSVLLDHEASLTSVTKRGFTPLHLAAKYGNIKVVRLLLQKDAPVDAQGKNGITPLHVATHYNHVNEALLLLEKGASPFAAAKNGFTPLHIAAKKNQMDIATTLLEYGAKCNATSKAGYTPLHLSSQEGHTDMTSLLIEHEANVNSKAINGLTPLHLTAQEDRVNVASVLVKNGAEIGPKTSAGYTPLHVASHFGQINMVRFLLQNGANVHTVTEHGYTPLHQAAQQGHTPVVNTLLEYKASPNATTLQGQTALSIAQRLGYISVVETLKVVTETTVITTTTTVTEEKYKVVAPEIMQENFMTDSEDEGGEDTMLGDQSYRYLTADEMKSLGDDSLPIDVTKDEKQHEAIHMLKDSTAPMVEEDKISPQHITPMEVGFSEKFSPDNIDISRAPVHAGFLVSFMVDARGGAMRGCRHSGVRIIIPPRKASMPMRITCRYLRKEKLVHPPPLMEGEACASRILEVGPVGARFLGPVIIEVPHFASLRGKEREVTILRSDSGETWREHSLEASEEAVQEVLNESFEGDELSALEDLNTNRITRILTTDFPQYFAIVTRIRQEVHGVGPEGGIVSSKVVPQVQAIFPEGALQKKIRVGLQAQPISPELVAKLLGNRVAVSPIVTVEPRRRKFHKPITLTIPVPQAATKGMINQYSGDAPTLRLLCSITGSTKSGGSSKAQWEDVTGSTPLTFVNDCVSFTTTVSARFWLMDCTQVNEVSRFATELYQEAVHVPFMAKFVIFAKRHDANEAQLRVFCMTDDKEDKTLETQEHFTEIAKSRDVEVLEGKLQHLEFAGNLIPVTNSKEQLKFVFHAFHENRLPFTIRVKDPNTEPLGRIAFMKEPKVGRGEPPQTPICNLNIAMPETSAVEPTAVEFVTLEKRYDFMQEAGLSKPESIHRANLRLSDISRELDKDWVALARELRLQEFDIIAVETKHYGNNDKALAMLQAWHHKSGSKTSGNDLEKALRNINREDIITKCMYNIELVTDDVEKAVAKVHLDQSGFDVFKEELGSSREASVRRGASLEISCDEQDIMKEAESAAETSSETGSLFDKDQASQLSEDKEEVLCSSGMMKEVIDVHRPQSSSSPSNDVQMFHSANENLLDVSVDNGTVEAETTHLTDKYELEILNRNGDTWKSECQLSYETSANENIEMETGVPNITENKLISAESNIYQNICNENNENFSESFSNLESIESCIVSVRENVSELPQMENLLYKADAYSKIDSSASDSIKNIPDVRVSESSSFSLKTENETSISQCFNSKPEYEKKLTNDQEKITDKNANLEQISASKIDMTSEPLLHKNNIHILNENNGTQNSEHITYYSVPDLLLFEKEFYDSSEKEYVNSKNNESISSDRSMMEALNLNSSKGVTDDEKIKLISASPLLPDESFAKQPSQSVEVSTASLEMPDATPKMTESEICPSAEMDTSHLSISSLPDDETSERLTTPILSTVVGQEEMKEKDAEWTEIDESGVVKHVIQKTAHMTLSVHQKSDDTTEEGGCNTSGNDDPLCETVSCSKYQETEFVQLKDYNFHSGEDPDDKLLPVITTPNVKDISEECLELLEEPKCNLAKTTEKNISIHESCLPEEKSTCSEEIGATKEKKQTVNCLEFYSLTSEEESRVNVSALNKNETNVQKEETDLKEEKWCDDEKEVDDEVIIIEQEVAKQKSQETIEQKYQDNPEKPALEIAEIKQKVIVQPEVEEITEKELVKHIDQGQVKERQNLNVAEPVQEVVAAIQEEKESVEQEVQIKRTLQEMHPDQPKDVCEIDNTYMMSDKFKSNAVSETISQASENEYKQPLQETEEAFITLPASQMDIGGNNTESEQIKVPSGSAFNDANIDTIPLVQHTTVKSSMQIAELGTAFLENDRRLENNRKEPSTQVESTKGSECCFSNLKTSTNLDSERSVLSSESSESALKKKDTDDNRAPLAFDNTAFAGADLIDASETSTDSRSRSPYEVIRDESELSDQDSKPDKIKGESPPSYNACISPNMQLQSSYGDTRIVHFYEQISENTRSVIRKRPILQQIPSEISEEDLVETDMISPTTKNETSKFENASDNLKMKQDGITSESSKLNDQCFQIYNNGSQRKNLSDTGIVKTSGDEILIREVEVSEETIEARETFEIPCTEIKIKNKLDYVHQTENTDPGNYSQQVNLESNYISDRLEHQSDSGAVGFSEHKSFHSVDEPFNDETEKLHEFMFGEKQFTSVSDEIIDDEIGKIINYDTQSEEDIIERPQTPEPPIDSELYGEVIEKYESLYSPTVSAKSAEYLSARKQNNFETEASASSGDPAYSKQIKMLSSSRNDITPAEDDFEIIEDSELEELEPDMNEVVFEGEKSSLRKMGSFKDITTVHLNRLDESSRDLDGAFASDLQIDSESGFAYGMQFEKDLDEHSDEAMDVDNDEFSDEKDVVYAYAMRFERDSELEEEVPCYGDLYTHHEEDEYAAEEVDKVKAAPHIKTDFDILAGRKFFTKNGDLDDVSVSSLQEFERLEEEFRSGRRSSIGSVDSLNGKYNLSKSGEHDDVSMNSLTEFEKLEREFTEAEKNEPAIIEGNARLSEIEEGHESQTSEASQETLSDAGKTESTHCSADYISKFSDLDKIKIKNGFSSEADSPVDFKTIIDPPLNLTIQQDECVEYTELNIISSPLTNETMHGKVGNEDFSKTCCTDTHHFKYKGDNEPALNSLHFEKKEDEDVEQDSLHEDRSMKPDSLSADDKCEYHDSLHEDKTGEVDSLQDDVPDDMRDSLHEEKAIDDDSLHEMDILPDESSLSLESSLAAVIDVSHDSLSEKIESHEITTEKDFDADSLKGMHLSGTVDSSFSTREVEIALAESGRVVDLVSSTDSLEQCSSAATHAAYQYETESLMSSSLNSVQTTEDYTMVSASDSIELDTSLPSRMFSAEGKCFTKDDKQKFILDAEGNIRMYESESLSGMENQFQEFLKMKTEELPAPTILKYNIESSAECTTGSGQETYIKSNEKISLDPDIEVEELSTLDKHEKSKVIGKVRKIVHTTHSYTSGFSSQNTTKELEDSVTLNKSDKGSSVSEEVQERSFDDKGNLVIVRTVQHQMTTKPVFYCKTFMGPSAQKCSDQFLSQFQDKKGTENIEEYQDVDEDGNITRVTRQVVVKPEISTLTFTGLDASQRVEDFMKQWNETGADSSNTATLEHVTLPRSNKMSVTEELQIKQETVSQKPFCSSEMMTEKDCGVPTASSKHTIEAVSKVSSQQLETSQCLHEENSQSSTDLSNCKKLHPKENK